MYNPIKNQINKVSHSNKFAFATKFHPVSQYLSVSTTENNFIKSYSLVVSMSVCNER